MLNQIACQSLLAHIYIVMNKNSLYPLFSKPIYKTFINVDDVDFKDIKWVKNQENWVSEDHSVLDNPKYKLLRDSIQQRIIDYFYGIMQAHEGVEIFITESWFNKTEKGQSHHLHWHPNSVVSGVVYLDSEEMNDSGMIYFVTNQRDTIDYNIREANIYNAKQWGISTEKGAVLLFPSNTDHMVNKYTGDVPRISLAFNTFVKGIVNTRTII